MHPVESVPGPSLSAAVFREKCRIRNQPIENSGIPVSEFLFHTLLQPFRDSAGTISSYEVTYELSAGSHSYPINLYFCIEYNTLSAQLLSYF
jgi:hypothetical protein